jgi:translation initiation factor 2-alpha kinase 4
VNELSIFFFSFPSFLSAKFLKLEQLDQDLAHPDTTGLSIDGTGQVGTYFYTAPEIEQGWPKIDEKV